MRAHLTVHLRPASADHEVELFAGELPPLQLVPATGDQEEALRWLRIESVIRAIS